jgi:2-iminobutanoate/2-iminopropanoate deaminase
MTVLRALLVGLALLSLSNASGAASKQPEKNQKAGGADHARRYVNLQRPANAPRGPFSDAVLIGDTLYIAGRIGLDPQTGNAPANVDDEIRILLDGVQDVLRSGGMTTDDLAYVQIFCTDLSLYAKFNDAYKARFKGEFPARAFIGVSSLLRGGRFEMMGIAQKK